MRGGTTLETPGAQNVLDRAEPFVVSLDGEIGNIFRPNLQGALLAKAYVAAMADPLIAGMNGAAEGLARLRQALRPATSGS